MNRMMDDDRLGDSTDHHASRENGETMRWLMYMQDVKMQSDTCTLNDAQEVRKRHFYGRL